VKLEQFLFPTRGYCRHTVTFWFLISLPSRKKKLHVRVLLTIWQQAIGYHQAPVLKKSIEHSFCCLVRWWWSSLKLWYSSFFLLGLSRLCSKHQGMKTLSSSSLRERVCPSLFSEFLQVIEDTLGSPAELNRPSRERLYASKRQDKSRERELKVIFLFALFLQLHHLTFDSRWHWASVVAADHWHAVWQQKK
jgi:hypothetical protein